MSPVLTKHTTSGAEGVFLHATWCLMLLLHGTRLEGCFRLSKAPFPLSWRCLFHLIGCILMQLRPMLQMLL